LIKGKNKRDNFRGPLELIADEIKQRLPSKQPVIKLNFISPPYSLHQAMSTIQNEVIAESNVFAASAIAATEFSIQPARVARRSTIR